MTADRILELLFAQCWQLVVVFTLVFLLVRMFAKDRPHLAHVLWLVVLVKCVTPPIFTSPAGVFSHFDLIDFVQSEPLSGDPGTTLVAADLPSAAESPVTPISAIRSVELQQSTFAESNPDLYIAESIGPDSQASLVVPDVQATSDWPSVLVAVWIIGIIVIAFGDLVRWIRFTQKRVGSRTVPSAALQTQVHSLAERLSVKRVRIEVLSGSIGPAVIGLFRPVILLPRCVVDRQDSASIEPIILHELTHIRRRDLWIASLQVVVRTIWWFHPLVWIADRMLAREAERACDEEVVAHLGDAGRYAHSMVDVLQLKHPLISAPAVLGIRPIQITKQRLERIMALRHGCRRKTPWWCWLVLVAMVGLTLPGATTAVGEQDVAQKAEIVEGKSQQRKRSPDSTTTSPEWPRRITVVGLVENPGVYEMPTGECDLLTALELAGGLKPQDPNPLLFVYRKSTEMYGRDMMVVNLKQVKANLRNPNFNLKPQDTISAKPNTNTSWSPSIGTVERFLPREPHDSELLQRLIHDKPVQFFTNVKTRNELITKTIAQPRFYPMIGKAELYTAKWNSTVEYGVSGQRTTFTTKIETNGLRQLIPPETEKDRSGDGANLIRKKLTTSISIDVSKLNIEQFARTISTKADVNVVVDRVGLEQEGLDLDGDDVSFNCRGLFIHSMMASSWLDMVCEQLRLTWAIRGEVILITSRERAAGGYVNISYSVSDLVVPFVQQETLLKLDPVKAAAPTNSPIAEGKADVDSLIELIQKTIAPDSWNYRGGGGAIRPITSNLSLVVRQQYDVHQEIQKLLESLRRLQDISLTMQIRSLKLSIEDAAGLLAENIVQNQSLSTASFRNTVILTSDDPKLLRRTLARSGATFFRDNSALKLQSLTVKQPNQLPVKNGPRVTLANGQHVDISLADLMGGQSRLRVKLIAGPDHKSVQLQYAVGFKDQSAGRMRTLNLQAGQVALIDIEDVMQQARIDQNRLLQTLPVTASVYRSVELQNEYSPRHYLLLSPAVLVQQEAEMKGSENEGSDQK